MTRIAELAREVEENTRVVDEYLEKHGLKTPSFAADGPVDLGIEDLRVERARVRASEASLELYDLLQGPRMQLRPKLNGLALQTIYRHRIFDAIPLTGDPITYEALSTLVPGLQLSQLRQVCRYAIAVHHVFAEPSRNHITHSVASHLLATEQSAADALGFMFDENWPAMARTLEAADKWAGSQEPEHTGLSLAMGTEKGLYGYYEDNPEAARRFASAMGLNSGSSFERTILAREVKWAEGADLKVVDVGGSHGHISLGLAKLNPGLRFVVQDLPKALEGAELKVPEELKTRVEFQAYDFFTEQPVKGADAYLYSHILHNWSDEHVFKILKNLVPALKKGSRVIVSDAILPDPGDLEWFQERDLRYIDMAMWTLYNARERERDDWVSLFKKVDERFVDFVFHTGASAWGVFEITWAG